MSAADDVKARAEAAISNGAVNHDLLRALLDALARAKAEVWDEGVAHANDARDNGENCPPDPDCNPYRADRIDPTEGSVTDHDFLPVAGHPDDNECTYRADGTDLTYCGEPKEAHR